MSDIGNSDEPTNEDRAKRIDTVMQAYSLTLEGRDFDGDEGTITDILTDIMHFCQRGEINFDEHVQSARMNFEAELVEESVKEHLSPYILTHDHLSNKPMRTPPPGYDVEFRLYDDDDVLYFTGVMTMALYQSANVLDPLDYAEGQWGCTRQDCKNPSSKQWETI